MTTLLAPKRVSRSLLIQSIALFAVVAADGAVDSEASLKNFNDSLKSYQDEVLNRQKVMDEVVSQVFAKRTNKSQPVSRAQLETVVCYHCMGDDTTGERLAEIKQDFHDYLVANSSDNRADAKRFFVFPGKKGGVGSVMQWSEVSPEMEQKEVAEAVKRKEKRAAVEAAKQASLADQEAESS